MAETKVLGWGKCSAGGFDDIVENSCQLSVEEGQNQEATMRLRQLCEIASETLEVGRGEDFRFTLESQHVIEVPVTKEHVINNRLNYNQVNE